jgi:hypothetical protein
MRTKFRGLSGLFNLVNEDFSDNGADFFINEGRKYLDRLNETQKSWASCFKLIEVGHFSVSFPYCRAIKEIWIADTTNGRWQLEKVSLQDLIEGYLTGFPSTRIAGSSLYYSPCITRYVPEDATVESLEAFLGFIEVPAGSAHEYNSILLNAPVQYQTMVDIRGLFYSHYLTEDTDTNYWSEVHPMLLYMAAMRYVEIANRNTQGKKDWETSIVDDMNQLGFDLVEELIAEVDQMEG